MRTQLKHIAVVAVLLAAACPVNRNAFAQERTLADKAQQSIVYIWFDVTNPTTGAKSLVYGTGFIVSKSGYVLTASHLFRDWGKQTDVYKEQNPIRGSLRDKVGLVSEAPLTLPVINAGNPDNEDVALLKLPDSKQGYSPASVCLPEASAAKVGDNIVGYGFPQNEPFQPVVGTLGTSNAPGGRWAAAAPFTHGMSGGPVYTKRGFVVGLIRGGLPGVAAVTWITPIRHAIDLLQKAEYVEDCDPGISLKPTVILMDSHIKDVVYCKHTQDIGGSNTDDIINLINDLPLHIETVSTHLEWLGDQRVKNKAPSLIVLHASAFYKETQAMEGNTRLIDFLNNLEKTNIKILVYTRGLPDQPPQDVLLRWERLNEKLNINKNSQLFVMPKGHTSCFTDPDVGRPFKKKIMEMLELK